jgi:hypothetical protein
MNSSRQTLEDRLEALAEFELPRKLQPKLEKIIMDVDLFRQAASQEGGRRFTLDGHFWGDIGGLLATHFYGLTLTDAPQKGYDARTSKGETVEIKLRCMAKTIDLYKPDFLLVFYFSKTKQRWGVVYDGPTSRLNKCGRQDGNRKLISLRELLDAQASVSDAERLPTRRGCCGAKRSTLANPALIGPTAPEFRFAPA